MLFSKLSALLNDEQKTSTLLGSGSFPTTAWLATQMLILGDNFGFFGYETDYFMYLMSYTIEAQL